MAMAMAMIGHCTNHFFPFLRIWLSTWRSSFLVWLCLSISSYLAKYASCLECALWVRIKQFRKCISKEERNPSA